MGSGGRYRLRALALAPGSLGVVALTRLETIIDEWNAQARARGNQPTRNPRSGVLAERTPAGAYIDAPPAVQQAEAAMIAQEQDDIEAWRKLQLYQDALSAGAQWLLSLPRRIVADVVGVPPWVITAALLGALGWVVYKYTERRA